MNPFALNRSAGCEGRIHANVHPPSEPAAVGSRLAFTLIEMIGVVAILALVASLMAPAVIQQMLNASRARDASELKGMADAVQSAIRRTGQVPTASGLPFFIANEMGAAVSQLTNSSQNVPRLFVADPMMAIGAGLPFDQLSDPTGLSSQPLNLRFLILSSLSAPLPTAFNFNTAWATPDHLVPADWTSWQGSGDDLTIQRIDFSPLFHRVILNNLAGTPYPSFRIEVGGVTNATLNNVVHIFDSWYLEKTVFDLHEPGSSNPQLQLKAVLQEDTSYFFGSSGSPYWSLQ